MAEPVAVCPECADAGETIEFTGGWNAARLARHRKAHHGVQPAGTKKKAPAAEPAPAEPVEDVGEMFHGEPDRVTPASTSERRPGRQAPADTEKKAAGIFAKLRGERAAKEKAPRTAEKRPRLTFRRQSTAGLFEFVWAQGGQALMMTGADVPVGRVLALQAPMVGDVLDDAIKGTMIDRAIQPFVRQGERAKLIGAVVLPPLIVGALERNPELVPTLMPVLRAAIAPMLIEMAKAAKKAKADEAKLFAALDEIADTLPPELMEQARAQGVNPIDALIASIFAPGPDEAEPAANGKEPASSAVA